MVEMTFHIPAFPHTQLNDEYASCPHTTKIRTFAGMMRKLGHKVIVYGGEHPDISCSDYQIIVEDAEQGEWFGEWDAGDPFKRITWRREDPWWQLTSARAIAAITRSAGTQDFICIFGGDAQGLIVDAFKHMMVIEPGVGYAGMYAPICSYESEAWMHYLYGRYNIKLGRWNDTVIPGSFDPKDFKIAPAKEDYLLYVGRVTKNKGPYVAKEIADRVGLPLKIAGPCVSRYEPGLIVGEFVEIDGENVEYIGVLDPSQRNEAMGKARALLCPTLYVEPFGRSAVEAMLCGTPVVATDWGGHRETVEEGVTGYRFQNLASAATAVEAAAELKPQSIRRHAMHEYGVDHVMLKYDKWVNQLYGQWDGGWYA